MQDIGKLAFSSQFRYERVALKSSVPFSIAGGGFASTTITVPHGLGYRPYVKGWYTFGSGKMFSLFASPASYNLDGNGVQVSDVDANTTDLVVFLENFGVPAVSGRLYYRIYAERQI
jgi:hypothetical protein